MNAELPEINVTRGEKLLAAVLAIFLLVGGLWAYFQPLDREVGEPTPPTMQERRAIDDNDAAVRRLDNARRRRNTREDAYVRAREEYRTDLDADAPAAASRQRFERARGRLDEAERQVSEARADVRRSEPAARRAERAISDREQGVFDTERRNTLLLRLGWVLACIALAFWLFNWLRRRRSPYFVAGVAAVIAATAQAVVMVGDYLGDEVDLGEDGPLVIALAGVTASLLALVGLERYLAKRAPRRRVRRGQCPYCAYPVRDGGKHCEGCGRATVAACATCSAERRVGTPHCAACGAA
jgi:hypothetical protein